MTPKYTLIRSRRRKTVQLSVSAEGEVILRAPNWSRRDYLDSFVASHEQWIRRTQEKQSELAARQQAVRERGLDSALFLGTRYPIKPGAGPGLSFDGSAFLADCEGDELREGLERLYRKLAADELGRRTAYWAERMGLRYSQVKINGARRRWGSCSAKGSINFSWRLVLAPPEAVDYLVIHELSHLVHMNHSADFWALVGRWCPEYRLRKKQLAEIQESIFIDGLS